PAALADRPEARGSEMRASASDDSRVSASPKEVSMTVAPRIGERNQYQQPTKHIPVVAEKPVGIGGYLIETEPLFGAVLCLHPMLTVGIGVGTPVGTGVGIGSAGRSGAEKPGDALLDFGARAAKAAPAFRNQS